MRVCEVKKGLLAPTLWCRPFATSPDGHGRDACALVLSSTSASALECHWEERHVASKVSDRRVEQLATALRPKACAPVLL